MTGVLYSWSITQVNFASWKGNQLVDRLVKSQSGTANFFTADNHSWLYLVTDTIPMIKSQSLKDLAYPTNAEKKLVFSKILNINPEFITFDALNNGEISANERFIIKNYEVFLDQYEFKGTFKTPQDNLRLWERKL
tara:strand:- start:359 stop:766 length:408 start_codon:yes stop_codon:yes gene_type:complete